MADQDLPRRRPRDGPVTSSSLGTVGLQSAATFQADMELKRRRNDEEFAQMDQTLAGRGAKTVFRDKDGRKVDVEAEARAKAEKETARKATEAVALKDWNTGRVDKEAAVEREADEAAVAAAPFAR